jgi:apolipoprotein D and lipocalin family protein
MHKLISGLAILLMTGCLGYPQAVQPVREFELQRYLGTWYEIARLDHAFERGLEQVTATYSMRDDGGVRVLNRGYAVDQREWMEAEGKAYFVRRADEGYLKVSFFGPFYGSYVIFDLDKEHYQYAFVCGPNKSYLWLLARTPAVSDAIRERFLRQATRLGFATENLIDVNHR